MKKLTFLYVIILGLGLTMQNAVGMKNGDEPFDREATIARLRILEEQHATELGIYENLDRKFWREISITKNRRFSIIQAPTLSRVFDTTCNSNDCKNCYNCYCKTFSRLAAIVSEKLKLKALIEADDQHQVGILKAIEEPVD